MVRIRQHGETNNLFDIAQFLDDIDLYFNVDAWVIEIEWCQGENSKTIEEETEDGKEYTDEAFRTLYSGITQTIDGSFQIKENNNIAARLLVVDSSYWEIDSTDTQFEQYMLSKYGAYNTA